MAGLGIMEYLVVSRKSKRDIMDSTARVAELEEAIRWVVTQQADDLCWMDAYVRLGKLVGVEITLVFMKHYMLKDG